MASKRYSGPVEPELVRELPTPELALALLKSLALGSREINSNNLFRSAEAAYGEESDIATLLDRLSDGWAWLEARGLIRADSKSWSSQECAGRGGVTIRWEAVTNATKLRLTG